LPGSPGELSPADAGTGVSPAHSHALNVSMQTKERLKDTRLLP